MTRQSKLETTSDFLKRKNLLVFEDGVPEAVRAEVVRQINRLPLGLAEYLMDRNVETLVTAEYATLSDGVSPKCVGLNAAQRTVKVYGASWSTMPDVLSGSPYVMRCAYHWVLDAGLYFSGSGAISFTDAWLDAMRDDFVQFAYLPTMVRDLARHKAFEHESDLIEEVFGRMGEYLETGLLPPESRCYRMLRDCYKAAGCGDALFAPGVVPDLSRGFTAMHAMEHWLESGGDLQNLRRFERKAEERKRRPLVRHFAARLRLKMRTP